MQYETIKDYLNDQFRLPLLNAFKNNDIKEVVRIVEFFCYKYEELNAFLKAYEDYFKEEGVEMDMPFASFVKKYANKNITQKKWKECSTAYSEDEMNVKELNELWDKAKKEIEKEEME